MGAGEQERIGARRVPGHNAKEAAGPGREWGRRGLGSHFLGSHVIQVSWSFTVEHLKPEIQFHNMYSPKAHSAVDWLQDRINIFQIPVKTSTFQFLPECLSGRNVSQIDARVL